MCNLSVNAPCEKKTNLQNMPRPRGADAAGLLLRELELHPPAEEWHRRNMFGAPWSDPEDVDCANDTPKLVNSDPLDFSSLEHCDVYYGTHRLWPRKRRMSERDAAFGLNTSVGLGGYLGIMGSRRDVVTATWKTGLEGIWYKVGKEILFICLYCFLSFCTSLYAIKEFKMIIDFYVNLKIWHSLL